MNDSTSDQALKEIEAAMRSMERLSAPEKSTVDSKRLPGVTRGEAGRSGAPFLRRALRWTIGIAVAAVLPFLVIVRLSVWLNQSYGVWPWPALSLGALASVLLLASYAGFLSWKLKSGFKVSRWMMRGVTALVVAYCAYTAIYVSASNVKTEAVRSTYTALHPLLRLGTSTWTLIDSDLVITDAERKPEDYGRMGLPVNEGSLHYQQESGYVHAIDLRTRGRSEWQNLFMTLYFKLHGFRTLRHTGTADHLHVSLPS